MACNISIVEVSGSETTPGMGITTLIVRGTAADCPEVCVSVHQDVPIVYTTPLRTVPVDNAGNWVAEFSQAGGDFPIGTFLCGYGNKFTVNVHCCKNPACEARGWDFPDFITCNSCPAVSDFNNVVIADDCNQNGTRSVTVSAKVTPGGSDPVFVQWLDDAGFGPLGGVISSPNTVYTKILNYYPGEHTARLVVISPEGCGDYETDPFMIRPCEPEDEPEPDCTPYQVTDITISEGACVGQERTYQAIATYSTPETPSSFEWEWSDGFTEVTQANQSTHNMPAAEQAPASVAVVAQWQDCSDIATRPLTITPCEQQDCRDYQVNVQVQEGPCQRGQREVTATASFQAPQSPSEYQWEWSDGPSQTTSAPVTSRTFDAGNEFNGTISVQAGWPNGCQGNASAPVRVQQCTEPPTTNWCLVWFWINIGLMAATGLSIFITACILDAAVWSAVGALASGGSLGAVWAALTAAEIILIIISAALLVITLISFIAWLIICAFGRARDNACMWMNWLLDILGFLVMFSLAVGIVLAIIGQTGCAIGGFIDVAWFGFLMALTWWISKALGCSLQSSNR